MKSIYVEFENEIILHPLDELHVIYTHDGFYGLGIDEIYIERSDGAVHELNGYIVEVDNNVE